MSNDSCNLTDWESSLADSLEFIIYHLLTPVFLFVGASTNFILLLSFYQQSKTERAYGYQVIFTISKTLQTFTFGTYLICAKWLYKDNVHWFLSNYALMSFFCFDLGFHVSFIISSLCLSLAMAADRTFAIVKPIQYRTIGRIRHQLLASVLCFLIGFLGGSMFFFDVSMTRKGDIYQESFDQELEHSLPGRFIFYIRLISRVGGVLLLFGLNIFMLRAFRRKMRRVVDMTAGGTNKEKTYCEKMLLWINIYQACFTLLNQLPHAFWQILLFFLPAYFEQRQGRLVGAVCDGMLMLTDTLDFFIIISIHKGMRRLVRGVICSIRPRWCGKAVRKEKVIELNG